MRDFLTRELIVPIARRLDADQAEYRAGLVMSQVVGLTLARYIVAIEPLATHPRPRLAADVGATCSAICSVPSPTTRAGRLRGILYGLNYACIEFWNSGVNSVGCSQMTARRNHAGRRPGPEAFSRDFIIERSEPKTFTVNRMKLRHTVTAHWYWLRRR